MFVVDLTMWPLGLKNKAYNLGRIEIAYIGGTISRGNYVANLFDKGGKLYKQVKINNFPRRKLLAFDLLYRVLKEAVGERNQNN
jgi:hypothetical protein